MKKILVALILLAGLGGYLALPSPPDEHYYASYLPEDTICTLQVFDLKQLSQTFPQSALGQFLAPASMQKLLEEWGVVAEVQEQYQETHAGLADILTSPLIQHLFGDDVVFALLAPDSQRLHQDPAQELQHSLLIMGSSRTAKGIDALARLLFAQDFTREQWAGFNITRMRLDEEESLYFYLENGIILLAAVPELLVAAVQRKAGASTPQLGQHEDFLAAQKFWTRFSLPHQAQAYFQAQLLSHVPQGKRLATRLHNLTSLVGLVLMDAEELVVQAEARYFADVELPEPQQKRFLGLLTDQSPLYFWFAALDTPFLKALWPLVEPVPVSPEDIGTALGPQFALVLREIVHAGFFPLPRLLLTTEVRHLPTAQMLVQQVRERLNAEFREQELVIQDQSILSWRVLPLEVTHPALALTDTILYAGTGASTLAPVLEHKQDKLSPAMHHLLRPELSQMLTHANAASLVLRPALLAKELEKAQSWLTLMLSSGRRLQVEKTQVALGNLMQDFDLLLGTVHFKKDGANFSLTLRKTKD